MPELKKRVLFIEDHPDTLQVITYALQVHGFEVLNANSVASGIAMGTDEDFHVLLSDIGLPDGAGWEVLQSLRTTKAFGAIALTAYASEKEREKVLEEGFDRYILKPFKLATLIDTIQELVDDLNTTGIQAT